MGEFVCYDLNEIFSDKRLKSGAFAKSELNIPKDPFLDSPEFKNYEQYKMMSEEVEKGIEGDVLLTDDFLSRYQSLNPDFWLVYYHAGKYYYSQKEYAKAKTEFEKALTKEITTVPDRENVEKYLRKTVKKLK